MRNPRPCPKCGGSGRIPMPGVAPISGRTIPCPVCGGTGYVEGR